MRMQICKIRTHFFALLVFLCVGTWVHSVPAEEATVLTRFKAVFIYNFIDYVQWPEGEKAEVFRINILGSSPLEEPLRKIAEKRSVGGRKLEVRVYERVADLETCQILFIPSERSEELTEIKEHLIHQSVLTVSDSPGMASRGVAINFALVKGKLKFEINPKTLRMAGLRASAQLLKLAILVGESG
jgi:hypothetical protein